MMKKFFASMALVLGAAVALAQTTTSTVTQGTWTLSNGGTAIQRDLPSMAACETAAKTAVTVPSTVSFTCELRNGVVVTLTPPPPPDYANLWNRVAGMNIGDKNYDSPAYQAELARAAFVILGFYPGWGGDVNGEKINATIAAIKQLNPKIKVGQYTVLNEARRETDPRTNAGGADVAKKITDENWWLRRADGSMMQYTSQFNAWDINFTAWTKPDASGRRYPEWRAQRDFATYFNKIPELDIWYFDNVMYRYRSATTANWKLDGVNRNGQTDSTVLAAWRAGMASHWVAARALAPNVLLYGNVDRDLTQAEFKGRLNGAFFEAAMGKSWSLEEWSTWRAAYDRYAALVNNTLPPKLATFNVHGTLTNYKLMAYGLATTLLHDGYFTYTDTAKPYSSVPQFDEYNAKLGSPIDPPTTAASSSGAWVRRYQGGMVLVNPSKTASVTHNVGTGYRKIAGTQNPAVNNGQPVTTVVLPPRSGLVLVRQ